MNPVILTERLSLRRMTMDDVDRLSGIFTDPEAMKYYPATKNREETEGWIRWNVSSYEKNGYGLWIAEFRDSGEFAGQCGLLSQEVDDRPEIEIGYLFLRKHWGRGLATEAALAVRDRAFSLRNCRRVISLITPGNAASIRVAEKVGMTFERDIVKWGRPILLYSMNRPA